MANFATERGDIVHLLHVILETAYRLTDCVLTNRTLELKFGLATCCAAVCCTTNIAYAYCLVSQNTATGMPATCSAGTAAMN